MYGQPKYNSSIGDALLFKSAGMQKEALSIGTVGALGGAAAGGAVGAVASEEGEGFGGAMTGALTGAGLGLAATAPLTLAGKGIGKVSEKAKKVVGANEAPLHEVGKTAAYVPPARRRLYRTLEKRAFSAPMTALMGAGAGGLIGAAAGGPDNRLGGLLAGAALGAGAGYGGKMLLGGADDVAKATRKATKATEAVDDAAKATKATKATGGADDVAKAAPSTPSAAPPTPPPAAAPPTPQTPPPAATPPAPPANPTSTPTSPPAANPQPTPTLVAPTPTPQEVAARQRVEKTVAKMNNNQKVTPREYLEVPTAQKPTRELKAVEAAPSPEPKYKTQDRVSAERKLARGEEKLTPAEALSLPEGRLSSNPRASSPTSPKPTKLGLEARLERVRNSSPEVKKALKSVADKVERGEKLTATEYNLFREYGFKPPQLKKQSSLRIRIMNVL